MNQIETNLRNLLSVTSRSAKERSIQQLAAELFEHIKKEFWFERAHESYLQEQSLEAIRTLAKKIERTASNDSKIIERIITDTVQNFKSSLFFTPEIIKLLYSPANTCLLALVNQGITIHTEIIRDAAYHVVHRYASGLHAFSLQSQNMEEELRSCVLEEIVRSMTDMSVRIWLHDAPQPLTLPPQESRGRRKGFITRVALTPDGHYAATARSDKTILIWDTHSSENPHTLDWSMLFDDPDPSTLIANQLYFGDQGQWLVLETNRNFLAVFQLQGTDTPIEIYEEGKKDEFLRRFGHTYIPSLSKVQKNRTLLSFPTGNQIPLAEYEKVVYHWSCSADGKTIITASEIERRMPAWMVDAGFERAVYHIAKMRLIDLIRKNTHTDYVCIQCGSSNVSRSDNQCPKCGTIFTQCPLGCEEGSYTPLGAENEWKCSRCGMASRIIQTQREVDGSELHLSMAPAQTDWADQHDLERIMNALRDVSIAYRDRQISCSKLVYLKSQGMTNEEIGAEIKIPRGSVDYVLNQCWQEVAALFGTI
jgi:DNA-directed RNA polymerase subunit RPC12/RpoP